jgi:hypothetical protein
MMHMLVGLMLTRGGFLRAYRPEGPATPPVPGGGAFSDGFANGFDV